VLNDLVRCAFGTTVVETGDARGLLDGDSILANIFPPHVVQGALAYHPPHPKSVLHS